MSNRDANLSAIKEGLYSISKQLSSAPKARPNNDIKGLANKLYNSLQQANNPVEKFYFIYLLCQICSAEKTTKVEKLMKILIPSQSSPQSMSLISDMISFALCHPSQYSNMLDYLSSYVDSTESLEIYTESWYQAETLALDSPSFCAALLCRDDLKQLEIDKKLVAKWLQDLSKVDRDFPSISLNQIIRLSLLDTLDGTESDRTNYDMDSDLHLGILTVIQSKRCQTLTNQFLIDIVTHLSQRLESATDDSTKEQTQQLVDRFAQILSVAAANKVTSLTVTLRNALSKLEQNQIIRALIKWQNVK